MLTGENYYVLEPGTRVRSLRPDVPAALDELLAAMLSDLPRERPWNGEKAAGLLKAAQADLAGAAQRKAQAEAKARNAMEQAQEQARLEAARKAQAEARAREQAEVQAREQARQEEEARIRRQAEQKKRVEPVPQARPVLPAAGKGFLARYWGWMALAVLLLGGCFVILQLTIPSLSTAAPSRNPVLGIGSTWPRPADGMIMMYVPGTTFTMGSDSAAVDQAFAECQKNNPNSCPKDWFTAEEPAHQVTLSAYWIDQSDVTNAEYAKCVAAGGCTEPSYKTSITHLDYYVNSQYANYPVINVNWSQAKSYCEWAGAKLPTEAQWELAARGTDGRTYPWLGNTIDESYANYKGNVGDTTAVCSYPQGNSPYGACDMAGNVWQWVADWYAAYGTSPVSDPGGPAYGNSRVLRGGSWYEINYSGVRSAFRSSPVDPSRTSYKLGFRCARSQ